MNRIESGKARIFACAAVSMAVLLCGCGQALPETQEPATAAETAAPDECLPSDGVIETQSAEPSPTPFTEPEAVFVHGVPEITGYETEVCPGQLRYVSQLKDLRKNGWGRFEYRAGSECTTACISMALSCIGIDESPEKLLTYSAVTVFADSYGIENLEPSEHTGAVENAEKGYETLLRMMDAYNENRDWTVSPVLLYLTGNGNRHGILVIGTEEDCWLVIDPASRGLHRISISEKGEISSWEGKEYLSRYTDTGRIKAKISALAQWRTVRNSGTENKEEEKLP